MENKVRGFAGQSRFLQLCISYAQLILLVLVSGTILVLNLSFEPGVANLLYPFALLLLITWELATFLFFIQRHTLVCLTFPVMYSLLLSVQLLGGVKPAFLNLSFYVACFFIKLMELGICLWKMRQNQHRYQEPNAPGLPATKVGFIILIELATLARFLIMFS